MTATWPTTPDTLPRPLPNTKRNASGFALSDQISDHASILERLESVAAGNLFINSNYDWWQRVESAAQTCTTTFNAITSFGPDRMFTLPAGASVTIQRSTTVPSNNRSRFSAAIVGAASVTTVDHGQRIRSAHVGLYRTTLTISAMIRNESGSAYTPTLRLDTPAAADDWTTPTNREAITLQSCADSAWTQVYATVDVSGYTNIANGLSIYLRIPSGSSVSGDTNRIAQFTVHPGVNIPMPFLPPDPETEKLRCLRYYRKSYNDGTALQTNTVVGLVGMGSYASGAQNWEIPYSFGGNPMWKAPTMRVWGKAGVANQFWIGAPTSTDNNTGNALSATTNGFVISNSATPAEQVFIHFDAVAELT